LLSDGHGLRVPGGWGGFELAVRALLGQQISVPAALRLVELLVRRLGSPLPEELARISGLQCCFPSADSVAEADLSFLPMPRARQKALQALAQAISEQPRLLQPGPGLESSLQALQAIPGVGPWTAHYIALRELREPDAFPASDAGLLRAWHAIEGLRPTPAELGRQAEAWRPWRAYAAQLLWNSLG
jgi:AraC family transcriptional regulator of adaptative response / DNA-3-methyladenine glycosylase II